ncbi:MAG: hypothetical protein NTW04_01285 [Elusimicrobia bacterium]|nr:hypothetical protein [Elusimicrobiota bacterium]
MLSIISFLTLALFFPANSFALEISDIKSAGPDTANIAFYSFTIENVSCLPSVKACENIVMPVSVSPKDGKKYADAKIVGKPLFDKLILAFKSGPAKKAGADKLKIKVVSVRKLSSPVRIANVDLEFDGELLLTFGLLKFKSSDGQPHYKVAYPDCFKTESEKLKAIIRNAVVSTGIQADAVSKQNA